MYEENKEHCPQNSFHIKQQKEAKERPSGHIPDLETWYYILNDAVESIGGHVVCPNSGGDKDYMKLSFGDLSNPVTDYLWFADGILWS